MVLQKISSFFSKAKVFLTFSVVSLLTTIIDNLVFIAVHYIFDQVLFSMVFARVIAGNFQFFVGKKYVFASDKNVFLEALKYWLLVLLLMFSSYLLLNCIQSLVAMDVVIAKIIAEATIFVLSFFLQKYYVFRFGSGK